MQTLFWIAVFASVGSVAIALTDLEQWEEFKKTYGKHYPHPATDAYHYAIFQQSLREVEEHNAKYEAGELTYSIKLIHLSDIPQDQWPVLPALPVPENFVDDDISEDVGNTDIPDAIDWREKGYVTHVKDQGTNCDGSYIFAVIGSLEAFSKRVNGDLVTLSEQNIRECYQDPTSVCNGQSPSSIIRFIVRNQSSMVESEHNYPFNRTFGQCKFSKTGAVNTHVQGHKFFFGEDKLKEVVGTVGPVIVIIRASPAFRRAHNGVFYDPTCKKTDEIDHAVLVVGYGTESGKDYWIIKNSWGTFFGDGGYLKMARNRDGNCHIGDWAIYPV